MKVKLADIVNNVQNIQSYVDIKFPIKVSYRIKRLIDKLQPILKTYDEKRNELIKEFGEEYINEKEEKVFGVKDPEKMKIFFEKLNELLVVEEEIDFEKVSVDSLDGVKLEVNKIVDFIFE